MPGMTGHWKTAKGQVAAGTFTQPLYRSPVVAVNSFMMFLCQKQELCDTVFRR